MYKNNVLIVKGHGPVNRVDCNENKNAPKT